MRAEGGLREGKGVCSAAGTWGLQDGTNAEPPWSLCSEEGPGCTEAEADREEHVGKRKEEKDRGN